MFTNGLQRTKAICYSSRQNPSSQFSRGSGHSGTEMKLITKDFGLKSIHVVALFSLFSYPDSQMALITCHRGHFRHDRTIYYHKFTVIVL